MKILAFFTSSGTPATGLSPTIRIRDLSDNSLVITDAAMSEVGDGHYQYNFSAYNKNTEYAIRCDGGVSLNESDRYTYAGNENYVDDIGDTITETTSADFDSLSTDILGVSAQNDITHTLLGTVISNQISLSASYPTVQEIVDGVWDEPLTGASHNNPTSSGRRLRQLSAVAITDGTAVSNGNGYNQIELNGDAFATDGAYDPAMIAIVNGTGKGQCRNILEYDGATKIATVDRNWKIQPDNTSEYVIYADSGREHVNEGLIVSAGAQTATLNALAASADQMYKGQILFIRSGKGEDQSCVVADYDGATRTATINKPWKVIPDSTSAYVMLPYKLYPQDELASTIWSEPASAHVGNGSFGSVVNNTYTDVLAASADIRSDIAQVAGDVWDQEVADHTIAGTFGAEVATKADVQAAFSTNDNLVVSGGALEGTVLSGTYLDTLARDNVYWQIQEDAVTGIIVEFIFNIPDDDRAGVFEVFGRYEGSPSSVHYMDLDAFNYESGSWENLVDEFMPGGNTSDALYQYEYFERHIDRDNLNQVRIRLRHHTTTYNPAHELFLDFVNLTSIDVTTAEDIANAVWSENPSGYSGTDQYGGIVNQINSNVVTISNDIKRLLGLTHENIFIDNPTYDSDGNLTAARVRIYSNPASVGTVADVIGTYQISAPSTAPGQFTTWKQVRTG